MRALVTGGGGFLAQYVVERLLGRDVEVRSFSRGDYPHLRELGVDCRRGDLADADAVTAACAGVDIVYHTASLAAMWGKYDRFYRTNVVGTQNVLAACRAHGIQRLVYTSTPSVVFPMGDLEGVDEQQPYPPTFMAPYPATKAEAEQEVLAAADEDLATCALRPHLIWGPRDTHIVPMLAARARQGKLVRIGDGTNRVDLTYVENAAAAHLLAGDRLTPNSAVSGQAYFISDDAPVNMWDWIDDLLQRLDLPRPERRIPAGRAVRIGAVLEAVHKLLPFLGEPRLTRFLASNFATSHYFDITKAKRDLDYAPAVDNETGLQRTVEWYQREYATGTRDHDHD